MRVVTWNLWWKFGPYRRRGPAIVDELARIDADVIAVQEVYADADVDQAADLAHRLGLFVLRTRDGAGAPQSFGNALLSRYPIEPAFQIALPSSEGTPGPRTALGGWVATPAGPQLITVTHLAWEYGAGALRERQLELIVTTIIETVGDRGTGRNPAPGPAPILCGDLNAVPEADEIRRLTGAARPYREGVVFTDAWTAAGVGPGITWTRDNPHSADATMPNRRLDYVLVAWPRTRPLSNPLRAWLAGTAAPAPDRGDMVPSDRGDMVPSDHYAVVVELDDRQTLGDE